MASFWNRLGHGLQMGASSFMDTYQTLLALQEAAKRTREDARQFDAQMRQRERETNISQSQWASEQQQQERASAARLQQLGVAQMWDSGLRAPPGVLADIAQPPAMSQFYGSQFLETPEFQQFGAEALNGALAGPRFSHDPDTAYGIGEPQDALALLREADQQRRDRQAQEALLQHSEMQRELGRRQTVARQKQADPGYLAGAPMALDAPALAAGGPTYGEFAGVSQEDLTHPGLRPDNMSGAQAATMRNQERMRMMDYFRERRLQLAGSLSARRAEMDNMKRDPSAYDRQLGWTNPALQERYNAHERAYSTEKQEYEQLDRELNAMARQMFPGLNLPGAAGGTGTPAPGGTGTPLPSHGTPERTGSMTLPDPNPGETADEYIDRLEELGYDMGNARHAANIQAQIRRFRLPLTSRAPTPSPAPGNNTYSPYNQW